MGKIDLKAAGLQVSKAFCRQTTSFSRCIPTARFRRPDKSKEVAAAEIPIGRRLWTASAGLVSHLLETITEYNPDYTHFLQSYNPSAASSG
jgi:hypothetical protein